MAQRLSAVRCGAVRCSAAGKRPRDSRRSPRGTRKYAGGAQVSASHTYFSFFAGPPALCRAATSMDFFKSIRRYGAPQYDRWSPSFSRMVESLVNDPLPLAQRGQLLQKLEQYVSQRKFSNASREEMRAATRDLLTLWEYLLDFVVVVSMVTYKELGFSMMLLLIQREEFSIDTLGYATKTDEAHESSDGAANAQRRAPEDAHLARRYKRLLLLTYRFVTKSMDAKAKFAEMVHFSSQCLPSSFSGSRSLIRS